MAISNKEKQAAFIARMKAKGFKLRSFWVDATGNIIRKPASAPEKTPAVSGAGKTERKAQWEAEVRAEEKAARLKAAQKAGRGAEQIRLKEMGFVEGVCAAALVMVAHDRDDIAADILRKNAVDRARLIQAGFDKPGMNRDILEKFDRHTLWS